MNIVSVADIGINAAERLLKKKAFDELTLSDRIRQNNMELSERIYLRRHSSIALFKMCDTREMRRSFTTQSYSIALI